jgi:Holliday junction DNA helicase RuvA
VIGWLSGRVIHQLTSGAVIVDVAGVGYEVHLAASEAPAPEQVIELFIFTVVREDAIHLFGFPSAAEREFFEMLIATPGVGPSTALGALRTMSVRELARAIDEEDVKKVSTIPGIGPKTASRIVLELKGKVASEIGVDEPEGAAPLDAAIEEALRGLGYSMHEVREALRDVTLPDDESEALRAALRLVRRA